MPLRDSTCFHQPREHRMHDERTSRCVWGALISLSASNAGSCHSTNLPFSRCPCATYMLQQRIACVSLSRRHKGDSATVYA